MDPDTRSRSRFYAEEAPRAPEGPVDLHELFSPRAEIEVELGVGRGMFLLERGRRLPRTSLLGIEIKSKWAYLVARRCRREGLHNVRVVRADIRDVLPRMGPDRSVRRVFLHFPDPWWKKRHAKRRLLNRLLVDEVGRLLVSGGEFFVQTDVEERALDYHAQLVSSDAFRFSGPERFVSCNPFGARSNRENRAERDGVPLYRILAERV
jgi:tRNA (guanine-N7-)-methyltransferase